MQRLVPRLALGLTLLACAPGCGMVGSSRRLDDARNRIQALQTENQQLRDVALGLRGQNRDLAQRAVEDSRRLRAQEEAIARYERSIAQYQQDRDQIATQLDGLRGAVRTAALEPPTTAMRQQLDAFGRSHATARVDAGQGTVRLTAQDLFHPGTAELTADGLKALDDLARTLTDAGHASHGLALKVIGLGPGVEPAATGNGSGEPAALGLARARAVRDRLAAQAALPPALVTVAQYEATPAKPLPPGADPAVVRTSGDPASGGGVEIQVLRAADAAAPRP